MAWKKPIAFNEEPHATRRAQLAWWQCMPQERLWMRLLGHAIERNVVYARAKKFVILRAMMHIRRLKPL